MRLSGRSSDPTSRPAKGRVLSGRSGGGLSEGSRPIRARASARCPLKLVARADRAVHEVGLRAPDLERAQVGDLHPEQASGGTEPDPAHVAGRDGGVLGEAAFACVSRGTRSMDECCSKVAVVIWLDPMG